MESARRRTASLAYRGCWAEPAIFCGLSTRRMHPSMADSVQPARGLSLDGGMGNASILQSARCDLRSAIDGGLTDQWVASCRHQLRRTAALLARQSFIPHRYR